jgi:hypothetical protein
VAVFGRVCLAVIMAAMVAANCLAEPRSPIEITCKIYGRYLRCQALHADDLLELSWVYFSNPRYEAQGKLDSGPVMITEKKCTSLMFFGNDPVTFVTHTAEVFVRLSDSRATFKDCEQKNVK